MNGDQKNLYNSDSSHMSIGGEQNPIYATPNFPIQFPPLNHAPLFINPLPKPVQQEKVAIPSHNLDYTVPSNDIIRSNGSAPITTDNPNILNNSFNPIYQEVIHPVMYLDPQTNSIRTIYIPQLVVLSNSAQLTQPSQSMTNNNSEDNSNNHNLNYHYPQLSNNQYNFNDQMYSFHGGAPNSANIQPTGDIYNNSYNTEYNPKSEFSQSINHHQPQHIQDNQSNGYQNQHENGEQEQDENDDDDDDDDDDEADDEEDEDEDGTEDMIDQNETQTSRNGDDCDSEGNSSDEDQLSTVHGEEMLQDMQNISFFRDIVKVPSTNNSNSIIDNSILSNKDVPSNVTVSVGSIVSESSTSSSSRFKKTRIKELTTDWNSDNMLTIDNLVTIVPDDVMNLRQIGLEILDSLLTEKQINEEENNLKDTDSDSTDNVDFAIIDSLATTDHSIPSSTSSKSTSTSSISPADQYNTMHKSQFCCEHTIISPSISDDSPTIQHLFLPYPNINSTTTPLNIPLTTCNSLLLPDKCLSSSSSNATVTANASNPINTTTTNTTSISNNVFNGTGISSNTNCSPGSNNTKIFPKACHRASIPFAHHVFFANNPTMLSAVMSPSIAPTSVTCNNSLFSSSNTTTSTTAPTVTTSTVSRHTPLSHPPRPISHDPNLSSSTSPYHYKNTSTSTCPSHKQSSYICYPTHYLSHHRHTNYPNHFNRPYNNHYHYQHHNHGPHHNHFNYYPSYTNNQMYKMSAINSTNTNSNSHKMKSRRRRWSISHYRSTNHSNTSSINDLAFPSTNSSLSITNQNCCNSQHHQPPNLNTNPTPICKNNSFNGMSMESHNSIANGDIFNCLSEDGHCNTTSAAAATTTTTSAKSTSSITVITNGHDTNGHKEDNTVTNSSTVSNGGNEHPDFHNINHSPCTTPLSHNNFDIFGHHNATGLLSPLPSHENCLTVGEFDRHIEDQIDKFKKSLQQQISHYLHGQEQEIKRMTEINMELEHKLSIESERANSLEQAIRDNLPASDWVKYDLKME